MAEVSYDVEYAERRNRLTTAFRIILAIPHLIVMQVWMYLTEILAVIQWFIILFTGKRNGGIWRLQEAWLGYSARVLGYVELLYDTPYPPFGTDRTGPPVRYSLEQQEPPNRLTNALRIIWAIPAIIIGIGIYIAMVVVAIISWFAILFTGKHPRGMFDFLRRAVRYVLRVQSYTLLMADTYPKF
jgi:hypothetical protein